MTAWMSSRVRCALDNAPRPSKGANRKALRASSGAQNPGGGQGQREAPGEMIAPPQTARTGFGPCQKRTGASPSCPRGVDLAIGPGALAPCSRAEASHASAFVVLVWARLNRPSPHHKNITRTLSRKIYKMILGLNAGSVARGSVNRHRGCPVPGSHPQPSRALGRTPVSRQAIGRGALRRLESLLRLGEGSPRIGRPEGRPSFRTGYEPDG